MLLWRQNSVAYNYQDVVLVNFNVCRLHTDEEPWHNVTIFRLVETWELILHHLVGDCSARSKAAQRWLIKQMSKVKTISIWIVLLWLILFTPITQVRRSIEQLGMIFSLHVHGYGIYQVGIHFSYLLCPWREEKPFGLSWNRTQVLVLHRQPCLLWLYYSSWRIENSKELTPTKIVLIELLWRWPEIWPFWFFLTIVEPHEIQQLAVNSDLSFVGVVLKST